MLGYNLCTCDRYRSMLPTALRIQEELSTAMAGLGTTHTEADINHMTRQYTLAREVGLFGCIVFL